LKKKDVLDEKAIAKVKPSDTCTVVSKQGEKTLFVSSDFTRNGAGAIATRNTRRAFSAVKVAIASLVAVAVAVAVYIDVFDFPVKKQRERERERERGRGRERETELRFEYEQKGRNHCGGEEDRIEWAFQIWAYS
jgi:hypothetical protein